jgi:preprotein translocase subunit SecA
MNKHREIIYAKRNKILDSENIDTDVKSMVASQIEKFVESLLTKNIPAEEIVSKVNEFI